MKLGIIEIESIMYYLLTCEGGAVAASEDPEWQIGLLYLCKPEKKTQLPLNTNEFIN